MKEFNSIKLSIVITNIFFIILVVFSVGLPWMVSWYAEVMNRSASLATTILVTCYPCAPFAAALLIFLKKLLKNTLAGDIFTDKSITVLGKMVICSIIISVITLIAGNFYMPFLIVGATFAFLALLLFSLKGIFTRAKE
jgi:hypothetical protein